MTEPKTMTLAEFGRHMGCKGSYVHQLKNEGRLVLTTDGKRVLVDASKARIAETRDPSKAGVAKRHEAERGAALQTGATFPPLAGEGDAGAEGGEGGSPGLYNFQDAKAKREHYAAEREHMLWRKEAGELMERAEVVSAFADAGATIRSKLEAWASVLPPQLAGRDEAAIRATITDQVERVLNDLVDAFGRAVGGEN
jgi:hypothetical protein